MTAEFGKRRRLGHLAVLAAHLVLLHVSPAVHAAPASPQDFSASAVRVGFDTLVRGQPVDRQYVLRGVVFQDGAGSPLRVIAGGDAQGQPRTVPHAAMAGAPANTVELSFFQGKSRVGMYFGQLFQGGAVSLKAYDQNDGLLDEVFEQGGTVDVHTFIGVAIDVPSIYRVVLEYPQDSGIPTIDDVLFEPAQDESAVVEQRGLLLSPSVKSDEKQGIIDALQLQPSAAGAEALRAVLAAEGDAYVRERAAVALEQLFDVAAIPTLTDVALKAQDLGLKHAAYNAVWSLRQAFPLDQPPQITLTTSGSIAKDEQFEVTATIVSPVDRGNISAYVTGGKALRRTDAKEASAYSGSLNAGEILTLRAAFVVEEATQTKLAVVVRVNLNDVDISTYRVPLYVDAVDGTTSLTPPFNAADEATEHVLPDDGIPENQPGQQP